MTDYTELKRLAEAFPADLDWDSNTEPFFNGPSGESLGGGSTGFYCVYGKPFRLEGEDYDYDGPTYVEACPADFAKFMVAAREGVLSLIAENERINAECKQLILLECHGGTAEVAINLLAERDQLKAENAAALREATDLALAIWRRRYAAESPNFQPFEKASSVIGQIDNMAAGLMCDQERLKAENEALRKYREEFAVLAERRREEVEALRNALRPLRAHWDDLKAGESLNVDAARAAMGKGEQS